MFSYYRMCYLTIECVLWPQEIAMASGGPGRLGDLMNSRIEKLMSERIEKLMSDPAILQTMSDPNLV